MQINRGVIISVVAESEAIAPVQQHARLQRRSSSAGEMIG